eukprot:9204916-Ditylum_brightwellii.AAC.1
MLTLFVKCIIWKLTFHHCMIRAQGPRSTDLSLSVETVAAMLSRSFLDVLHFWILLARGCHDAVGTTAFGSTGLDLSKEAGTHGHMPSSSHANGISKTIEGAWAEFGGLLWLFLAKRSDPGFEPGASSTQRRNHASRPIG